MYVFGSFLSEGEGMNVRSHQMRDNIIDVECLRELNHVAQQRRLSKQRHSSLCWCEYSGTVPEEEEKLLNIIALFIYFTLLLTCARCFCRAARILFHIFILFSVSLFFRYHLHFAISPYTHTFLFLFGYLSFFCHSFFRCHLWTLCGELNKSDSEK